MGGAVVDVGPTGVKAPDGGWGWAVLVGCFVITGFSYAFPKAVSVFFKELIREFGVGYSDTAWISSILLAMLYGTGRLLLLYVIHKGRQTAGGFSSVHQYNSLQLTCRFLFTVVQSNGIRTCFFLSFSPNS